MRFNPQIRINGGTTEYPALSIMIAMALLFLSPFVSSLLPYGVFVICLYRVIRYDAKVFATDYCLLIPIMTLFRTPEGMSLLIWLCLAAAIWYFVRGKIRADGTLVCMILLLNYLLLRMQMNINDFVLCFGQLFVLYVLIPKQDTESAVRAAKAFCWSLLITSAYALVFRNSPQIVEIRGPESPAIWGTTIMRFYGMFEDPNYYMTLLVVALAVLCKFKETGRIHSILFWSSGVALTFFGILTYSKTFFLVFLLLGGVYIIWQFWSKKVFKGVFFAAMVVAAGLYLLLSDDSPFSVVIARLTSSNTLSDITTGRSDLLVTYWKAVTENVFTFLFGRGLNAPLLEKGAHNLFLEIVYFAGLVGLVLIMMFYGGMLKNIQKTYGVKQQSIIAKYVVVLIMAAQYCALQGMFQPITYGGIFVAFLSVGIVSIDKKDDVVPSS